MSTDDATLVRRCLSNDPEAVRDLIARFQSDVYGLCVRLLHHRHDAEDVCQEVFVRVFRGLPGWDASRPLKPWVMGIAINRCRTWLKQRARKPEPVDFLHEIVATRSEDDSVELLAEILAALDELRQDYRMVFVLFHEQGHPYETIAAMMQRPIGTIKTWLHRARLEILERLRQRGMIEAELPLNERPQ